MLGVIDTLLVKQQVGRNIINVEGNREKWASGTKWASPI